MSCTSLVFNKMPFVLRTSAKAKGLWKKLLNRFFFFYYYFLTSDNLLTVRVLFDAVLDENNDKTWQWREFFAKRLETALSKVILRKDTPQAIGRREISDKLLIYIEGNVKVFSIIIIFIMIICSIILAFSIIFVIIVYR